MNYRPYNLADVYEAASKKKFTVISTFSGTGGSSLGYKLAGGHILCVNEFVEAARKSYSANFPETQIIPNDIRELCGQDFLDVAGIKKGELDVLDSSPPCSSFSMSGIREAGHGKIKSYSDTKQRTDDLAFEYTRILKDIQPKFTIMENVQGLTLGSAANILGSNQVDMFGDSPTTIYQSMVDAGYNVRHRVVNAKHYGVPQSRARIIIVGVRKDIDFVYKYPVPFKSGYVSLEEAFRGVVNTPQELLDANIDRYAIGTELKKLKPGEQSEKYFSLAKMDPKKYANTLTQTAGNISAASIASWENRKFTVQECKRIMGFPDDYNVGHSYNNQIERLGRAVSPPFMKAIAEQLPF